MTLLRRSALALLILTTILGIIAWQYGPTIANRNDGFRIHRIYSRLQHDTRWETAAPHSAAKEAVKQKYTYLGKGAQCYAFASADGKYVLKFFKHQHLSLSPWLEDLWLPGALSALREKSAARKQEKLDANFGSYTLAYERLQQQTGLLAVHLNKTEQQWGSVAIEDVDGNTYRVALDIVEFIIQERAERIDTVMQEQPERTESIVVRAADVVKQRLAAGVIDTDPAFLQNYGVTADGRVIQIDVGRFEAVDGLQEDAAAQNERFLTESQQLFEYVTLKAAV